MFVGARLALRELLGFCVIGQHMNWKTSAVDSALRSFGLKNLLVKPALNLESSDAYKEIDEVAFNSENKYHVKLLQPIDVNTHNYLFGYRVKQNEKHILLMVKG